MDKAELCGHMGDVMTELERACIHRDWADAQQALQQLTRLQQRLWRAVDFTIDTGYE